MDHNYQRDKTRAGASSSKAGGISIDASDISIIVGHVQHNIVPMLTQIRIIIISVPVTLSKTDGNHHISQSSVKFKEIFTREFLIIMSDAMPP